jgi:hypothetical protein
MLQRKKKWPILFRSVELERANAVNINQVILIFLLNYTVINRDRIKYGGTYFFENTIFYPMKNLKTYTALTNFCQKNPCYNHRTRNHVQNLYDKLPLYNT